MSLKVKQKDPWEREASIPEEYHSIKARRGREFIVRMMTEADAYRAPQKLAKYKGIRFGKIRAVFMASHLQGCSYGAPILGAHVRSSTN